MRKFSILCFRLIPHGADFYLGKLHFREKVGLLLQDIGVVALTVPSEVLILFYNICRAHIEPNGCNALVQEEGVLILGFFRYLGGVGVNYGVLFVFVFLFVLIIIINNFRFFHFLINGIADYIFFYLGIIRYCICFCRICLSITVRFLVTIRNFISVYILDGFLLFICLNFCFKLVDAIFLILFTH